MALALDAVIAKKAIAKTAIVGRIIVFDSCFMVSLSVGLRWTSSQIQDVPPPTSGDAERFDEAQSVLRIFVVV